MIKMVVPIIIGAGVLLLAIWFSTTGGLDDIGENISILIMGLLLGVILSKVIL